MSEEEKRKLDYNLMLRAKAAEEAAKSLEQAQVTEAEARSSYEARMKSIREYVNRSIQVEREAMMQEIQSSALAGQIAAQALAEQRRLKKIVLAQAKQNVTLSEDSLKIQTEAMKKAFEYLQVTTTEAEEREREESARLVREIFSQTYKAYEGQSEVGVDNREV